MRHATLMFVFLVLLGACSRGPDDGGNVAVSGPAPPDPPAARVSVYQAAVNHVDRSDRDIARDAARKPGDVLEFFGIKPGMAVLDMFSGGGYYTELASRVVGASGRVVAHTNAAYAQFVGDEATSRYADDRLPNVQILMAENNELDLPASEFDAVLMILAFHDIFYVDSKNGWPRIDGPRLLAELYQSMKPGAVLGVVDHYAEAGSPRETGGTLHRIDPEIVIADLGKAGFLFDGRSEVLRNMEDDYGKNMADPAVRGRTDRFVFRFRKPD